MAGRGGSVLADVLAICLAACLAAAVPAHVGAQSARSFELDDVMSFPYPSAPVAAEDADRLAWTEYREGVRNVWTAAAPDFEPQRLTDYAEDDGQPLGDLALTPDGSTVVYVRGGDANQSGEHPNPTSDPDGAEQAVWAVRTDGGEPWRVGEGDGPEPSPDGTEILFTRSGTIYLADLTPPDDGAESPEETPAAGDTVPSEEAGRAAEPEPLFRARGGNGSPRWSPDGAEVLFTSSRGDHAFLGVYDREADAIRWIAPSVDRDGPAVWSPDGERIAFVRTPGAMRGELYDLTGGSPFSVWVADADGGEA
ncbi:MAG: TolB family protein, partial [Gemmatimonadota bacterium]